MYRRIVVPLDGSDLAERALVDAGMLATLAQVPVHLVRVVEFMARGTEITFGAMIDADDVYALLEDDLETARHYLDVVARRLTAQGVTVTCEVRRGPVAQQLVDAAEPGDLLLMASHGRTGISRWFMGSVAEEVVRRSDVPVLLIRAGAGQQTSSPWSTAGKEPSVMPAASGDASQGRWRAWPIGS
jgi:nucleotide-binding universal stress UspA family protein